MESLLQHLDRFSEVLWVSRTSHVGTWDAETVRRALRWARYLRHVYGRFARRVAVRQALEQHLQTRWRRREADPGPASVPGLKNFQTLGSCEVHLALNLLENRALGEPAYRALLQQLFPGPGPPDEDEESLQESLALLARRRAALHLLHLGGPRANQDLAKDPLLKTQAQLLLQRLQEEVGPAGQEGALAFLCSLWQRVPRDNFLKVLATVLLLKPPNPDTPTEQLEPDTPNFPLEQGSQLILHWLLGQSEVLTAFCHQLPAELLTSVAGRYPTFFQVYVAQLIEWGRLLHYDLLEGSWLGPESCEVSWGELLGRFQSLWHGPSIIQEDVRAALESCKAQEGDFEVSGISVWTDLLAALQRSAS